MENKKCSKPPTRYVSIMLSIVLEMMSKMCGIETSPIPEIAHDLALSYGTCPNFYGFSSF